MFKRVKLEEIIDFSLSKTNSSSFTKSFINSHKGNIPVYGASLDKEEVSYGYVQDNLKNIKYFENCLTWNIDGSLGVFYRKGYFSLSEKVIPLYPFDSIKEQIDLNFLKYSIRFSVDYKRFGFNNKAGKGKLKNLEILIPVLEDETYDLNRQKELALKYKDIEKRKEILRNKIELLKKTRIHIEDTPNYEYREFKISELFTPKNGSSTYTKEWCQQHKGNIPLYSGNTFGAFAFIDTYDYNGEYLTWSKDGLAGYLMINRDQFSLTGHRGILIPKDTCKNVDLLYLKLIIEPIFRANIKGRMGINGKNEYTTLNSVMINRIEEKIKIPITPDGSFDLEKQKEIAQKYATIESIKQDLYNQVLRLINIVVE